MTPLNNKWNHVDNPTVRRILQVADILKAKGFREDCPRPYKNDWSNGRGKFVTFDFGTNRFTAYFDR